MDDVGDAAVGQGLAVEVGLGAGLGAVDELVGDQEGAGAVLGAQSADRARAEDLAYAERAQGPQVGAVVDAVRWEVVATAVPGQEGDLAAA